jgi:GNAT superfamily N-acetyltransferase
MKCHSLYKLVSSIFSPLLLRIDVLKSITQKQLHQNCGRTILSPLITYINPTNKKKKQIGFARVISDLVTFSYLTDVFILKDYRQKGLGKWLIKTITDYDKLKIRRMMLNTDDGHSLYSKFGFEPLDKPSLFMQIKGKGAI